VSDKSEFSVDGFNADICEPAELRHTVLNGSSKDIAFEVTKLIDNKWKLLVSDDTWAAGKFGEIDCQVRGVRVAGAKAHERMTVTIKEITRAGRGMPPYL
jgi:hypothetical protein